MKLLSRKYIVLLTILWAASVGIAQASLIGQDVTVAFQELGFLDETDTVNVGPGAELLFGDGSNIGDFILSDVESIDIGEASIQYTVEGLEPDAHPADGFAGTGFGPSAQYFFSSLTWGVPGSIIGVDIVLSNVIDVSLGTEVMFTADSVTLVIGSLGVREVVGAPNIGTILLNLQVEHGGGGEVPEPSTVALVSLALAGLWTSRRRGSRER